MTDILLIYITCRSSDQAKYIGETLLKKRLCACINIVPGMESTYFWPPKSNTLESNHEVVLIVKTLESKYQLVEDETKRLHTYENPCILSIPVSHIRKEYYDWLTGELEV